MAKKVRERALDTRAAREKLKVSGKPYYRSLGPELHLGYRKGKDARRWVARIYLGHGQYRAENIGYADDVADADGQKVLTFWQAQDKARATQSDGTTKRNPNGYTIRQAVEAYITSLEGKPTQRKTELRLKAYVPPALADKPVAEVTADNLNAWLRNMVKLPPRARTAPDAEEQNFRDVDMDNPEIQRKRKSSANRVMTNLRAALNLAFKDGKVPSDREWRRVKPYKSVEANRDRYLTISEAGRLIRACDPDFRTLVQAALATGARYAELARLEVRDFNPDSGTVHVRRSKSGDARHVVLTEEGIELFAGLSAGRARSDLIMGREWRDTHQVSRINKACQRAKIDPPITFHGLRHTWASHSVMAGLPLMVVAKNLGHKDTKMVERHYGHLAPSYVAEAIRKHAPRFGGVASKVKAIRT